MNILFKTLAFLSLVASAFCAYFLLLAFRMSLETSAPDNLGWAMSFFMLLFSIVFLCLAILLYRKS